MNNVNLCLDKIFLSNKNIESASLYFPINNEISPFVFVNYLLKKNVTLCMPVLKANNNSMIYKFWKPDNKLKKGLMGNLEPLENESCIIPQIVVVPMLMFNRDLYRLGYGGGYYDKSIFHLKKYFQKEKKFFITIGIAYSIQETKNLPIEKHDMHLDYIITEKEVLCRKNQL